MPGKRPVGDAGREFRTHASQPVGDLVNIAKPALPREGDAHSTTMTSSKRKQQRLAEQRLLRAKAMAHIDPTQEDAERPDGAVPADPVALSHNNTYGFLPRFYIDRVVTCRTCGTEEVWTAQAQQWWYEVAKASIESTAVLCRACRAVERERKDEARRVQREGLAAKAVRKAQD